MEFFFGWLKWKRQAQEQSTSCGLSNHATFRFRLSFTTTLWASNHNFWLWRLGACNPINGDGAVDLWHHAQSAKLPANMNVQGHLFGTLLPVTGISPFDWHGVHIRAGQIAKGGLHVVPPRDPPWLESL